jgi:hypothetical protein
MGRNLARTSRGPAGRSPCELRALVREVDAVIAMLNGDRCDYRSLDPSPSRSWSALPSEVTAAFVCRSLRQQLGVITADEPVEQPLMFLHGCKRADVSLVES